jgi:hypothetical protein
MEPREGATLTNWLVVGDEPAKEPHQLDIAAGLALEPPARLHPIEIAEDIKLRQH